MSNSDTGWQSARDPGPRAELQRDFMIDSEQRYLSAHLRSPGEVSELYWRWLTRAWGPLVSVSREPSTVHIRVLGLDAIRLEGGGAGSFDVAGGALAQAGGRFGFRSERGVVVASLEGFRPRLPLWIYRLSHGPLHEWTMRRFGQHLSELEQRT